MSVSLIEARNSPSAQNPNCPMIGKNYELKLNQSVRNLLTETRKGAPNFSHFIDEFQELMQAKLDPSLESVWVYTGLTFCSRNSPKDDLLDRISASKDLFPLVSACSVSCSGSKSIALLAPVVFEVYSVVVELFGKDLALKRARKAMREAKPLVEAIIGHINVCCCKDYGEECGLVSSNLMTPFADLVRIWINTNDGIESFLPLVSSEVCERLSAGGCSVGHLAGVVIAEVFLLELCLRFRAGIVKDELEKELRSWTVGSITGFGNFFFFETLVQMLLEATLPVTSLLSSEDEVMLRNILNDAIILVDYSFLSPERAIHIPAEHMKHLAIGRLIITHKPVEFFREVRDQTRALSYINAFASSRLPSQIIKLVTSQIGLEENANRSVGSSPKALIKWLLKLEDRGVRVFDDSISQHCTKLVLDISKADPKQPSSKSEGEKMDEDILFYVDKKGGDKDSEEDKMNESNSASFVAAAHTMKLAENGGQKRKKGGRAEKEIKFIKYDLGQNSDSARARPSFASNDGFSSDSEVKNPVSDEETETKE